MTVRVIGSSTFVVVIWRKVTCRAGRQGSRWNRRDMRQLLARLCHISHASRDDRVVSPSSCECWTRCQLPAARCAAMRCIPWSCSVFSLGSPFFATRASLRFASAIPHARTHAPALGEHAFRAERRGDPEIFTANRDIDIEYFRHSLLLDIMKEIKKK